MRTLGAFLALSTSAAWAHPGHGPMLPHLHAAEWWGLVGLVAVIVWLVARNGRR